MTFFDHVLTDRITVKARQLQFWRGVLTVLASVLYGAGWVSYKAVAGLWFAAVWCAAAVMVGWREAHAKSGT